MTANLFRSIIVALLIPFTFACTGMSIFISNSAAMSGTISSLVSVLCVLVGIVALCLFFVQLPFLFVKKNWFPLVNSLLFGGGFLLWLQANVFNWNFGQLDGSGVNWSAFRHLMILEIVVYLMIVGLIVWKRQWFNRYVIHFACLLMFMQTVPLAKPVAKELISMRTKVAVRHLLGFKTTPKMYEIAKQEVTPKCPGAEPTLNPNIPAWKQYDITFDGFFDYSPEQNVVLIIPDTFSSELFQRMMRKHPEVGEWFSDFNYFSKQKSQAGTYLSIPQILTACDDDRREILYDRTKPEEQNQAKFSLWNSEGALQKTLATAGFQTRLSAWVAAPHHWDHRWISNIRLKNAMEKRTRWNNLVETGIGPFIDLLLVRSTPIVCKPADIDQFSPTQAFLTKRFALKKAAAFYPLGVGIDDAVFARVMADNPVSATSKQPVLSIIHLKAAHRPYDLNEKFEMEQTKGIEGEERQAFASLLLLQRLVNDMKEVGVYDNSLIVIAADHGNGLEMIAGIADAAQYYNPLLLVKRPNERHATMAHRTEHTNVRDISPTILDIVGLDNPPGRFSVFEIPSEILAQREVEYEAFWAMQREFLKLQAVTLGKGGGAGLFCFVGNCPETVRPPCQGRATTLVRRG